MTTLNTKINKFISQINFEADGSIFLTIQREFEITLEDNSVVKVPHTGERVKLEVDDPNTELVASHFAPAFFYYWDNFKQGTLIN